MRKFGVAFTIAFAIDVALLITTKGRVLWLATSVVVTVGIATVLLKAMTKEDK